MTTYLIIRDGHVKLRLPANIISVDADGYLQGRNGERVIDGELADAEGVDVRALAKARQWSQIPRKYWLRLGTSPSGALVIDAKTWEREQSAAREAAMTPADRAWRDQVTPCEREADAAHRASYCDPARICLAESALRSAIANWRAAYPEAARAHDARSLDSQAEHEEELAVGALTYDADGWIGHDEQQRRHDEHMAKAAHLRAMATELRGGTHVNQ